MDRKTLQNVESYACVNYVILKTQHKNLKGDCGSLSSWLQCFPRREAVTAWVPHPVGPKRAGRGRGPARPAPHDAPPRRARACAVHTKRPRAPRREVRGLREAASGASGPDGLCGMGAEPARGEAAGGKPGIGSGVRAL